MDVISAVALFHADDIDGTLNTRAGSSFKLCDLSDDYMN